MFIKRVCECARKQIIFAFDNYYHWGTLSYINKFSILSCKGIAANRISSSHKQVLQMIRKVEDVFHGISSQ